MSRLRRKSVLFANFQANYYGSSSGGGRKKWHAQPRHLPSLVKLFLPKSHLSAFIAFFAYNQRDAKNCRSIKILIDRCYAGELCSHAVACMVAR